MDENYISTMKIELLSGRNFLKEGDRKSIIINERMAEALGLSDPIGERVIDMFDLEYNIIGVVRDFHFESVLWETRPLALVKGRGRSTISVKIRGEQVDETMAAIERLWSQIQPNQPIRYQFMNLKFESMYEELKREKGLFMAFSILSISIACSGLFAVSVYMTERRRKEVGVRKVLGASMARIMALLGADFVKLIFVAIVIASPMAWYFLDEFMADFAYRIELEWYFFLISGLLVLLIGLGTVSYEIIKATLINPAETLQDE